MTDVGQAARLSARTKSGIPDSLDRRALSHVGRKSLWNLTQFEF